jgi:hypothetical protein
MDTILKYEWQQAVLDAFLELEPERLSEKLGVAERTITRDEFVLVLFEVGSVTAAFALNGEKNVWQPAMLPPSYRSHWLRALPTLVIASQTRRISGETKLNRQLGDERKSGLVATFHRALERNPTSYNCGSPHLARQNRSFGGTATQREKRQDWMAERAGFELTVPFATDSAFLAAKFASCQ